MRIIYFKRHARSQMHIHANSDTEGVYIPDENVVLYQEQHGSFGRHTTSIVDRKEFLDEIKPLAKRKTPNKEGVIYSGIVESEYDDKKIKDIIQDAKKERDLRKNVESRIEALLEEAK